VLVLDMIEILPPWGKYKYDTWRILLVKCYINNSMHFQSCIRNVNTPSISTMIFQKTIGRDLLRSVNQSTLASTVSTCSGSDRKMSLTTTSATSVLLENRGSCNKMLKDWPNKVLRIHMTNFVDGWDHLCMLILN
jgi:hypothetical protein